MWMMVAYRLEPIEHVTGVLSKRVFCGRVDSGVAHSPSPMALAGRVGMISVVLLIVVFSLLKPSDPVGRTDAVGV